MLSSKDFTSFKNEEEKLEYLRQWKFISSTQTTIPEFYLLLDHKDYVQCEIIGFEKNCDTFSITVVDYGQGPYFIHCDYLQDMQKKLQGEKGTLLNDIPNSYVIFDLETTDLSIYKAYIIEIGALKIENGSIIDEFSVLVKPPISIPAHITKLTGINDLMVWNADDIYEVLKQFIEFIGDYPLAGYNIKSYDMKILYEQTKRIPNLNIGNDYIDLLLMFKKLLPNDKFDIENHKLVTVAEYFDIDTSNAHRAIEDCYLCYECLNKLLYADSTVEDVNILISSDNLFEAAIIDKLKIINDEFELLSDSIILVENKSIKRQNKTKSIIISEKEYPLVNVNKIPLNMKVLKLEILPEQVTLFFKRKKEKIDKLPFPPSAKVKILKNDISAIFTDLDDLLTFIDNYVRYRIRKYRSSSSFGCCSKHVECSDLLKCVHENKLYSTGCSYRHNLEQGRIFYGKNRNIDS